VFGNSKSLVGFLAMVGTSFLVILVMVRVFSFQPFSGLLILTSLSIALVAGLVEFVTPFGLDNITVPLITSFLVHWLFI